MIVVAALDLLRGAAVQLVGGDPGRRRVHLPDPRGVARVLADAGCPRLHLVDLDAALGRGRQSGLVADVIATFPRRAQVGGGLRDDASLQEVLVAGADRAVVGTRAIDDPAWLEAAASRNPGSLVVALDVTHDRVLTHGWRRASRLSLAEALVRLEPLPLAAVLVTDVGREGRLAGVDARLFRRARERTRHVLCAAGGVASLEDLEALERAGVDETIVGSALYEGRIRPAHLRAGYWLRPKEEA